MNYPDSGFGTPFIEIYTGDGKSVDYRLVDRIVDFIYAYCDESGDEAQITIKTQDLTLPDLPELQIKSIWTIKWGFKNSLKITSRLVRIIDIIEDYTSEGLTLTILAKDPASIIAENTGRKSYENADALEIAEDVANQNGLNLDVDNGENKLRVAYSQLDYRNGGRVSTGPYNEITTPSDNTFTSPGFIATEYIAQMGKSDQALINSSLAKQPEKWQVDTRDDTITLRKRNLGKKPITSVYYRGDRRVLLSFKLQSLRELYEKSGSNMVTGAWDSASKSFTEVNANNLMGAKIVLGENIVNTSKVDKLGNVMVGSQGDQGDVYMYTGDKIKVKKPKNLNYEQQIRRQVRGLEGKIYENYPIRYVEVNSDRPTDYRVRIEGKYIVAPTIESLTRFRGANGFPIKYDKKRGGNQYLLTIDERIGKFWRNLTGKTDIASGEAGGDERGNYFVSPEDSIEESINDILNDQSDDRLKLLQADALVIGDPIYQSSEVISILGISKKNSGNYYIAKAIHRVNVSDGYLVNLTLYREGQSFVSAKDPDQINARDYGIAVNTQTTPDSEEDLKTVRNRILG